MNNDLVALASAYGVATEFWDQAGAHHVVSQETVVAVLAALGVDASTPATVGVALEDRRLREWRRALPPVFVSATGRPGDHLGAPAARRRRAAVDRARRGRQPVGRHPGRPLGRAGRRRRSAGREATFAAADGPAHRMAPVARRGRRRGHHLHRDDHAGGHPSSPRAARGAAQPSRLGVRGPALLGAVLRSWGLGDLADLAELARLDGGRASAPASCSSTRCTPPRPMPPMEPSPYLPGHPALRQPDLPAGRGHPRVRLPAGDGRAASSSGRRRRAPPTAHARPARPRPGLGGQARRPGAGARGARGCPAGRRLRRLRARARGRACRTSRLWCALADEHGPSSRDWPEELRTRSPTVRGGAREARRRAWSSTAGCSGCSTSSSPPPSARRVAAGMAIGVMHDLAVGVHPDGADAWALRRRAGARRDRRCAAGHVQPAWARTGPSRRGARTAGGAGVRAVPRHAPHGAAARRRHPHRPHPRPVPAVVDPARAAGRPRAPTSATTTRRSSASWRSRRSGPGAS